MSHKVTSKRLKWKIMPVLVVLKLLTPGVINGQDTNLTQLAQIEKAASSEQTKIDFPKTPAGEKARLFWEAFLRSDTQGVKKFFESSLPPEKLKENPAEKELNSF